MTFHWATFIFQTVNFAVLVAILWKILWTPLRRHMKDRADRIAAGLAEVNVGREEILRLKAQTLTLLEEARSAKVAALRQAELEANARRAEMLDAARRAVAEERDRMLAQVANDQQRRDQEFLRSLTPTIGVILEKLLRELGRTKLNDLACDRFADWLEAMSVEERARWNALAAQSPVDVTTANGELSPRVRTVLDAIIPIHQRPTTRADPQLIAGVRLRVGESVLDGSLSAQIARVLERMEQMEQASPPDSP